MEMELQHTCLNGFQTVLDQILIQEETLESIVPDACPDIMRIVDVCGQAVLTGKKLDKKIYSYFTGHVGGRKEIPYRRMMEEKSDVAVFHAVKGMLPKNSLGKNMIKKLRVYKDDKHNHQAQQPEVLKLV